MFGRPLIMFLLGIISVAAVSFNSIFEKSNQANHNMSAYYLKQTANNISQSGLNMALRELANDITWRTGFALTDKFNGKLKVRLVDTTYNGSSVIKIESIGITFYGTENQEVALSVAYFDTLPPGFVPPSVLGAVSANSPIETLGTITVDGRDHDLNGNLIPNSGTLGIWTTNVLNRSGNSQLASTAGGTDYAPVTAENDNVRLENQTYPGGYPATPDNVMGGAAAGYPPGTLKTLAQSGVYGSQYVTDPSLLTAPLSGITYVELPEGVIWSPAVLRGSGVLIVHNGATNTQVKNPSGIFKGLVIVDDITHIHGNIIGALIAMSPSPSEGNCIGNGDGNVLYSREAIEAATSMTMPNPPGSSADRVIAWWD